MKNYAVTGFIGSGKDTVSNYLKDKHNYHKLSFAKPLKDACASIFGWERNMLEGDTKISRFWREEVDQWWAERLGIPHFTPRFALQHIGTDVLRNHFSDNIWMLALEKYLVTNMEKGPFVISDCRFKNEITLLKQYDFSVLRVIPPKLPHWYDVAMDGNTQKLDELNIHRSEWELVTMVPDITIDNSKRTHESLKNLYTRIDQLCTDD